MRSLLAMQRVILDHLSQLEHSRTGYAQNTQDTYRIQYSEGYTQDTLGYIRIQFHRKPPPFFHRNPPNPVYGARQLNTVWDLYILHVNPGFAESASVDLASHEQFAIDELSARFDPLRMRRVVVADDARA